MRTTRSGSEKGRPRRKRSCIKLKIAVFMPMPSASVSTARKVNPGDLRSWRRAKRRSFIKTLFRPQCHHGIDACGTACRKPAGDERNDCEREQGEAKSQRIGSAHAVKHTLQTATDTDRAEQSDNQTGNDEEHSLAENETENIPALRSERETNAELARALRHGQGHHSV